MKCGREKTKFTFPELNDNGVGALKECSHDSQAIGESGSNSTEKLFKMTQMESLDIVTG